MASRIFRNLGALIAALASASLAACSTTVSIAGPTTAAALASKLHCQVSDYFSGGEWAYDTAKGANLSGGLCTNGGTGLFVITFPSLTKEDDWLHKNAATEHSSKFPDGYFELVVGHLWVIGTPSGGGLNFSFVIRALGGKVTTF